MTGTQRVVRMVCRSRRRRHGAINGQPLVFKGLAGLGAGPALIWASLAGPNPFARAITAGVGALVTVIDGTHFVRALSES